MSAATPTGPTRTADPPQAAGNGGAPAERRIDWSGIAAMPEFRELHSSRRRYTLTRTALAAAAMLLAFGLYGFAPDAMGEPAIGSLTWALVLGLALVALTFALAFAYTRKAREWDLMAARVLERAQQGDARAEAGTGRFVR